MKSSPDHLPMELQTGLVLMVVRQRRVSAVARARNSAAALCECLAIIDITHGDCGRCEWRRSAEHLCSRKTQSPAVMVKQEAQVLSGPNGLVGLRDRGRHQHFGEGGCCAGRSLKATEQSPQMQRVPDPSHTIAPNARGSTTLQSRNRPPGKKPMMSKRCGPPVFSTHRQGKSRSAASKERQIMGTDQKGGGSSSITR